MSYVVDKEVGFPIPSEKERINRALRRYRSILSAHSNRSDAPEIMFGIADLLVGRGEGNDRNDAMKMFDQVLLRNPPEYLKARALIGKAELMIGKPEEFDNAISLSEKARQILGKDLAEFFAAKTFIVEAELLLARQARGDWAKAINLFDQVIKEKSAHWYFRGRALLGKAEILLYSKPDKLNEPLKLIDLSLKELADRTDDYFFNKNKVLKAEILTRRGKKADLKRIEKMLTEVVKMPIAYKDLIARAKLNLADIGTGAKAEKFIKDVSEMEGVDPYLIEKARLIEQELKNRKKK
ncbi:MAG: hypothetical protein ABIH50_07805 [bacterium]